MGVFLVDLGKATNQPGRSKFIVKSDPFILTVRATFARLEFELG